jgi:beta-N-acetylhexosaminidase
MGARNRSTGAVALAVVSIGLAAACGSGSDDGAGATTTGLSTTAAPAPTVATPTAGPSTSSPSTTAHSTTTLSTVAPTTVTTSVTTSPTTSSTMPAPPVSVPGSCVDSLTTREQAALLVWPSVYSSSWADAQRIVADTGIGGVLLMRPDGWTSDELTQRLASLEDASRHGLVVATDEEGGDVQRLRLVGELPSQRQVSTSMLPAEAADLIAEHAAAVRATGVDMVLGPVVDVEPNAGEVPLQPSRFFVGEPAAVSAYAAAYIDGWAAADLLAVVKHFPGHGAASGDTHITAGVTPSFADIERWDLQPYRDLVGRVATHDLAVMIGHLTVPGLTNGVPATRSPEAIDHLRNEMGYGDALLITDALGMNAVGLAEPEASVLAVAAGIDIVIFTQTSQTSAVIDALVAAVDDGRIAADRLEASAAKVMRLLERDGHTCNRPT